MKPLCFAGEFRELARVANLGLPGGPAEYSHEFLLVLARTR
jgi:hypothetical protein